MFSSNPEKLGRKMAKYIETNYQHPDAKGKVIAFLARGADPNGKDVYTALCSALRHKCYDIAEILISRGADVNKACGGKTPLMHVCGDTRGFEILLAHGADGRLPGAFGASLLMEIMRTKNLQHAAFALETGIDIDVEDVHGNTALIRAIESNYLPGVRFLLENGADVNRQSTKTRFAFPLHLAAYRGKDYIVELLLEYGADPAMRSSKGQNALDIAVEGREDDAIRVLTEADKKMAAEKTAAAQPGWHKLADDEIAHVSLKEAIGYKLTEIFNFRNGLYTRIAENTKTGAESQVLRQFSECRDIAFIEEAARELYRDREMPPILVDKPRQVLLPGKKPGASPSA